VKPFKKIRKFLQYLMITSIQLLTGNVPSVNLFNKCLRFVPNVKLISNSLILISLNFFAIELGNFNKIQSLKNLLDQTLVLIGNAKNVDWSINIKINLQDDVIRVIKVKLRKTQF
jgi:hypothetical protein